MNIQFSMWIATKTRWAHLTKVIEMPVVPHVGEFMKFRNEKVGDYFAIQVTQVTYRERAEIDVWTELLDNVDDRMYSFEDEAAFDDHYNSYLREGWQCPHGVSPNTKYASRQKTGNDDS